MSIVKQIIHITYKSDFSQSKKEALEHQIDNLKEQCLLPNGEHYISKISGGANTEAKDLDEVCECAIFLLDNRLYVD